MKLLLDNNLSPRLIVRLAEFYPHAVHVASVGLDTASDVDVWQFAHQRGFCIVSKDADFNDLLAAYGFPPKVIWIRLGNCTSSEIAALLLKHQADILTFLEAQDIGLLELF